MWVHPKKQMCFLANPKTASTATYLALEILDFEYYGNQHCTPDRSKWDYWREINNDWTIFCTIRNHYDVMVSWFFHNIRKPGLHFYGQSFETFLYEYVKWQNWFRDGKMYWERNPWCNKILRYEALQKDFDQLLIAHNFPIIKLEIHNASKNRKGQNYRDFYSDATKEFMEEFFGDEMEELGYSF
jgi:hypothetical protein